MKRCALCKSIILEQTRPMSFVVGALAGECVLLHRFCLNDWLYHLRGKV